jgi:hypothetical protein
LKWVTNGRCRDTRTCDGQLIATAEVAYTHRDDCDHYNPFLFRKDIGYELLVVDRCERESRSVDRAGDRHRRAVEVALGGPAASPWPEEGSQGL